MQVSFFFGILDPSYCQITRRLHYKRQKRVICKVLSETVNRTVSAVAIIEQHTLLCTANSEISRVDKLNWQ